MQWSIHTIDFHSRAKGRITTQGDSLRFISLAVANAERCSTESVEVDWTRRLQSYITHEALLWEMAPPRRTGCGRNTAETAEGPSFRYTQGFSRKERSPDTDLRLRWCQIKYMFLCGVCRNAVVSDRLCQRMAAGVSSGICT